MVFLLLNFIPVERNSDCSLHLEAFAEMLVYNRAYDHYKYMSWGLVYLYDMYELPEKHPDLHQYFMSHFHIVSRSKAASTFNCVPTDIVLEQGI